MDDLSKILKISIFREKYHPNRLASFEYMLKYSQLSFFMAGTMIFASVDPKLQESQIFQNSIFESQNPSLLLISVLKCMRMGWILLVPQPLGLMGMLWGSNMLLTMIITTCKKVWGYAQCLNFLTACFKIHSHQICLRSYAQ